MTDVPISYLTNEELKEYIATASKRANSRLRTLEDSGFSTSSAAYKKIQSLAFEGSERSIVMTKAKPQYKDGKLKAVQPIGKIKFSSSTRGASRGELMHQATLLGQFLEAKTSTVQDIKEVYKTSYETFKENWDGDSPVPSMAEMAEFWSNKSVQEFMKIYGSDEIVKALNSSKGKTDRLIEMVEQNKKELRYMARLKSTGNKKQPTQVNSKYYESTLDDIWTSIEKGY